MWRITSFGIAKKEIFVYDKYIATIDQQCFGGDQNYIYWKLLIDFVTDLFNWLSRFSLNMLEILTVGICSPLAYKRYLLVVQHFLVKLDQWFYEMWRWADYKFKSSITMKMRINQCKNANVHLRELREI